jgi:hypothetical protein
LTALLSGKIVTQALLFFNRAGGPTAPGRNPPENGGSGPWTRVGPLYSPWR